MVKRKLLNTKGSYITIADNDFFANPNWKDVIAWLGNMPVDIQNIDVRKLTVEKCKALNGLRRWKNKQFKIAWDDRNVDLRPKLREVLNYIPARKLMCYVLIGYWYKTEGGDLYRVEALRELGISPFVMPFDKSDPYQRAFARWVNHKAIFNKVKWEDYRGRVMAQEAAGTGWNNN